MRREPGRIVAAFLPAPAMAADARSAAAPPRMDERLEGRIAAWTTARTRTAERRGRASAGGRHAIARRWRRYGRCGRRARDEGADDRAARARGPAGVGLDGLARVRHVHARDDSAVEGGGVEVEARWRRSSTTPRGGALGVRRRSRHPRLSTSDCCARAKRAGRGAARRDVAGIRCRGTAPLRTSAPRSLELRSARRSAIPVAARRPRVLGAATTADAAPRAPKDSKAAVEKGRRGQKRGRRRRAARCRVCATISAVRSFDPFTTRRTTSG